MKRFLFSIFFGSLLHVADTAEKKAAELFFILYMTHCPNLSLSHRHTTCCGDFFFFFYDAEGTHRLLKGRADGNHASPPTGRRAKAGVARCRGRVCSHAEQTEEPAAGLHEGGKTKKTCQHTSVMQKLYTGGMGGGSR